MSQALPVSLLVGALLAFSAASIAAPPIEAQNAFARNNIGATIQKMWDCPAGVNEYVRQALSSQRSLPPKLRRAKGMNFQYDPAAMIAKSKGSEVPPDVQAKMEAIARKMGMANAREMQNEMLRNSPKTVGNSPPGFMAVPLARITLLNNVKKFCDADCELAISWSIVSSIGFWRNACHLCKDDFFAITSVGNATWVDQRIAAWLNSTAFDANTFPVKSEASNVSQRLKDSMALPNATAPTANENFLTYALLDADTKRKVCVGGQPRPSDPQALRLLHAEVCGKAGPADATAVSTMQLTLTDADNVCGSSKDFLACGHVDKAVEIGFANTRYAFSGYFSSAPLVYGPAGATEEASGDHVLMHEIGHWFGLPHVDYKPMKISIPDVMQDSLSPRACASELSLWLINNMSSVDYQSDFRLSTNKNGMGLRRK